MRALVIGGGIGGVTAAHSLRQAGLDVTVYERADDVRKIYVGSGIHLWNNAMSALEELGLDRRVMDVAGTSSIVDVMRYLDHKGRVLVDAPVATAVKKVGAHTIGINRAELLEALSEGLDEHLVLGRECTGFRQDADGVTALFADGSEERGDVLVGADGAYSRIRAQLLDDPSPPLYAGYTIWQGITRLAHHVAPIGLFPIYYGPGLRFAFYHVDDERVYWFAVANAPEGGSEPPAERVPMLLERFRGWPEPIEEVIASTDAGRTHRRDLYYRRPDERWGDGRVTLLGDAAHAMTFDMGQGAGQSIEDAVVLGRCLGRGNDPVAALRRYEQLRRKRAAHFQRLSLTVGRIGQWSSRPAVAFRTLFGMTFFRSQQITRVIERDLVWRPSSELVG